ncbi:MAG: vWA domain-containing protein [Solirubrobacteraceae bacterium]
MSQLSDFTVETVVLDLPALSGAFGRRLHAAGLPVTADTSARFAAALTLAKPISRRRLYFTARAVFVSDQSQVRSFDRVFADVFGAAERLEVDPPVNAETVATPPDERQGSDSERAVGRAKRGEELAVASARREPAGEDQPRSDEFEVPTLASADELLRAKRFDSLEPGELADLYRLMAQLRVAPPMRRTRRARRDRHGDRIDMRRTLRRSLRTAGEPIRLARRRRRVVHRRLVMLCDISGSMEPYARAYLQFLTCAAGARLGRGGSEAFVFATRLTRLTRALSSRNPERAIQRAAATAPDWSSGTRIGEALKEFNDRHGRRGMARGAVVVILSDGWERGDPALVGREMQRLARLAYRIVWVNPRVAAEGFAPRAGGMAAALPHCAALVSGHTVQALEQVVDAIAAERSDDEASRVSWRPPPTPALAADGVDEEEPWASATPVAGSSVSMPSGYSPSRGNTTPGWSGGLR